MTVEVEVRSEESGDDADSEDDKTNEKEPLGRVYEVVDGREVVEESAGEFLFFKKFIENDEHDAGDGGESEGAERKN